MAKTTVEECLVLDAVEFARKRVFSLPGKTRITWRQAEEVIATLCVAADEDRLHLLLLETEYLTDNADRVIELERTLTSFGATRVWFLCPRCFRSCRKLYLPPRESHFLCRSCHALIYRSRQQRNPALVEQSVRRKMERLRLEAEQLIARVEEKNRRLAARSGHLPAQPVEETDPPPQNKRASTTGRSRGRPKEKRAYVRTRPFLSTERETTSQALCLRCRDWREMKRPSPVVFSNGRPALRGICPVCGARMCQIMKGG